MIGLDHRLAISAPSVGGGAPSAFDEGEDTSAAMANTIREGKFFCDPASLSEQERRALIPHFKDLMEGDERIKQYTFQVYAEDPHRVTLQAQVGDEWRAADFNRWKILVQRVTVVSEVIQAWMSLINIEGQGGEPAVEHPARSTHVCRPIDLHAVRIPQASGLLPCLFVPVAARDTNAIEKYVGRISEALAPGLSSKALLVEAYEPMRRDERLPIWRLPEAAILHATKQVWVHVDYTQYRRAYSRAFPGSDLKDLVLDHVANRRVARLKGHQYLRIVPISRAANSSHGGLSECWAVAHHSRPGVREINKASKAVVQYADLSDLVKMLNMQGGGSFMDIVNDAQNLVDPP
jgi:hypothetical protein